MMETKEQIRQRINIYAELMDGGFCTKEQYKMFGEWIYILGVVLDG
jgi:hypothetical protein